MTCPCAGSNPANLKEIVKCVEPTLFHRVDRPASLGDDIDVPATDLDYRNVLLVYQANNHAYLYSSDGIPTFISMGQVNLEKIEAMIKELQQTDAQLEGEIEANKISIEQNATAIQTQQEDFEELNNALEELEAQTVQKDTTVSGDASTVTITKTLGTLENEDATETALPLPVASSEQAGVMNLATYQAVQANSENIDSILNGAVLIDDLPATPTQDELTMQWKATTGKSALINRASIYDKTNGKIWYYYINVNEWEPADIQNPEITISQATNEALGIVKGSTEDGQVAVEADGSMSLNGYDGIQHDIDNLSELVAGIDVPKMSTYVLGGKSTVNTNIDNALSSSSSNGAPQLTWQYVNTATGATSRHTWNPGNVSATGLYSGWMTVADKQKLDSLLVIKSLNDSLSLDENGQLSVVGGGSDVNLLSEYTATVGDNDTYNASYVNSRLDSNFIHFGANYTTSSSSPYSGISIGHDNSPSYSNQILIGFDVKPTGKNPLICIGNHSRCSRYGVGVGHYSSTNEHGVALGDETTAVYSESVALGHYATTGRAGEVSIGAPSQTVVDRQTRYLANVRAGELPTDAVNLKQMQDYVAENVGGGVNLLDEFVLNPSEADVYSANTINSRINNLTVQIGRQTSVPVGTHSVALGFAAKTSRENEVSIGNPDNLISKTRFLANLKAGVLPTDAVNVQQMEGYVGEHGNPFTEMETTRAKNLPPAVVTGFEDTTYGTDTITMHLDTKDLATGGVSVQELELPAAVPATSGQTGSAGIMSVTQATQLQALAEAYQAEEKGTVLYEGTASVNTIELSEAATSFVHICIVGEYMGMGSSALKQSLTVDFYPNTDTHAFQMTATDITVGDTPMVTTLQDIWMLSGEGIDLDLVSSTKAEQGGGTLICTPDTTSQFTIVKVVGFGKM